MYYPFRGINVKSVTAMCMMTCVALAECAHTPEAPKGGKLCALTFDDGPDPVMTGRILDRLEKYGVNATFFVVGNRLNDGVKPTIDRMMSLGCELENHSWDYGTLDTLEPAAIREKTGRTSELILKYSGRLPRFFRPPNLATSPAMHDSIDLAFVDGVVCNDWAACGTGAQERAAKALEGVEDGAIILLHDVQPEPHPTPEALDIIIPALKRRGYEFVTVSELFRRKGISPAKKGEGWTIVR
jgi:peptidoglycan-N-acetylglucosamine deacetylase